MKHVEDDTFGTLRFVEISNEPWFIAADVCAALTLRDTTSALRMLEDDEKLNLRRSDTPHFPQGISARVQSVNVVCESGVYALIFQSNKPEARQYRRWITSEVLPAIRKHGGYLADTRTATQNARFAEMIKYREATDMLTLANDYEPSSDEAKRAFTRIQDMLLVKVTGMHAPEIRRTREIRTWKGKRGPTVADRKVAKNYLSEEELTQLAGYSDIVLGSIKVAYPAAGYSVEKFWATVADIMRRY